MITLKVKQNRIGPVVGFHPWVFSQAITRIPDGLQPGEPVKVTTENEEFLALGYFGSYSQIAVRIWGYDEDETVDGPFFERRIERAYGLRRKYVENSGTDAYRLVNGENDYLPGLIVDKYADYLVVQFHTKGIEAWKEQIIEALQSVLDPKGIYERSDVAVRKIEKLDPNRGLLRGDVPDLITIRENGFSFLVDVKGGQKTGFFLDQRDKRQAFSKYTKDRALLNCFAYTGGFSVYGLAGGAGRVVSVDTSAGALELARENIRINGLDTKKCEFVCEDVKRFLRNEPDRFDALVLDPPAFIKDRHKRNEGIAGYKSINEMALRCLNPEGILVTCSCSAHLSLPDFRYLLSEVGGRTKRPLRFLETFTHGIDHLQLVPYTEGEYLKCFFISA
jgi:23S rRNA (cytosine1962-C5)-methyltransferase